MKNSKFLLEMIAIFIIGCITGVLLLIGIQKLIFKNDNSELIQYKKTPVIYGLESNITTGNIEELKVDKAYYFTLENKKGSEVFSVQYYPNTQFYLKGNEIGYEELVEKLEAIN